MTRSLCRLRRSVNDSWGTDALSVAVITGGNPYRTTTMAWKYTLPAFLVPFMFTLHPDGVGLLLKGGWGNIVWTTFTAAVGLAALAAGLTGWLMTKTTWAERGLLIVAGLVLIYPSLLEDLIGLSLFRLAVVLQLPRCSQTPPLPTPVDNSHTKT